ncbi:MAG: RNA-binding protein [Rubritalea sp.]|uniref:RNA recognition motif domain-containing protein n=1 Tax=Rubritalea sp. TaxID=2109375 RepID=UPI0032425D17
MSDTQKPNQGNREGGNRRPRRNNNNNRNRNNNGGGSNNRNRNRNRNNRPPKPLVLTFWQKILKAIGCLDEDKIRKAQRSQPRRREQGEGEGRKLAPKSNTRNAKTGGRNASDKPRRRAPQPVAVESARLYVGNLSYDATEHDLEDLFKGVGTVKNVEIIYNRNTHKSKGYGFIQMLNKEEAERAVEVLHDQPFMSRQLVVNGSKSRKEGDTSGLDKTSESA